MADKRINPLVAIQMGLAAEITKIAPTPMDNEAMGIFMRERNQQIVFPPYSVTRNKNKTNQDPEV